MSAFASLFADKAANPKDQELDALFARTKSVEVVKPGKALTGSSAAKAVRPPEEILQAAKLAKNKAKASSSTSQDANAGHQSKRKRKQEQKGASSEKAKGELLPDSEDDQDLEDSYAVKKAKKEDGRVKAHDSKGKGKVKAKDGATGGDGLNARDTESEAEELVHETVLKARKAAAASVGASPNKTKKQKAPADETPADRDARTTFIGNVAVSAATSKSARKALVRHLISTLPTSPIDYQSQIRLESIRFRSLQLNAPVPLASGKKGDAPTSPSNPNEIDITSSSTNAESRARKRARKWRENELGDDDEDDNLGETTASSSANKQKFLTAAQKRKVAFIKGELHEKASSCNAYAVWTTMRKPSGATNESATAKQLADLIVKHANNSSFEGLTIRVDHVRSSGNASASNANGANGNEGSEAAAASLEQKKQLAAEQKRKVEEEKRTLYLGSLDFEETEESVRKLCEKLMVEERGEPSSPAAAASSDSTPAPHAWVERVRVIKDPETGLGKGFAYVLFRDRECVDEMLALEPSRVKLSKRKLRMERCNTTKQAKKAAAAGAKGGKASNLPSKAADKAERQALKQKEKLQKGTAGQGSRPTPAAGTPALPNINLAEPMEPRPDHGEELKGLSKEDRKALKASDAERLQRRLEKKQRNRLSIKEAKSKELIDKKLKFANDGRKVGGTSGPKTTGAEGKKKSRIRSDKAIVKKNTKKTDS